jgi:two-component system sensor histidine kinase YesM
MKCGILMRLRQAVADFYKGIYLPLRIKLSLAHLFLVLLPSLVITYLSYSIYTNSVLTETTNRMKSIVTQTNLELDTTFDTMKTLLLASYSSEYIKQILYNPRWTITTPAEQKLQDFKKLNDFFRGMLYLKKNVSSIRFIPLHGISITWYENALTLGYLYSVIPWKHQITAAGISEVFIPPHKPLSPLSSNQGKIFSIGKLIRDFQGKILSYIIIDIKINEITDILNKASIVNNLQTALISRDNRIIFGSKNLNYNSIWDDGSFRKIRDNVRGLLVYKINGEKYILIYNTSRISGWKFVAFTKISSLLIKANQMRAFTLIVILFSIIISLLLSILLSTKLTNPLAKLSASMKDIENKNFNVYLPTSSNDEIGILTRDFNSMVEKIRNLIIKEYQTDLKRKDAELKVLELQINPHFLYNTLETIYSIAYLKNIPEIATISQSLSQLFRYSISYGNFQVTLADELSHTINYVNIQKIRHGDKFDVLFEIDDTLKNYKVIKLILQPLIENSITHGLESIKSGGLIITRAKLVQNQTLVIQVEDNGVGIDPEKLVLIQQYLNNNSYDLSIETTKSIGLANIHFRIQYYYGKDYGLTIENIKNPNEKWTRVTLQFPATK